MRKLIIPLFLTLTTLLIVFNEFKEFQKHTIPLEAIEYTNLKDINFSKFWSTPLDENLSYNQLWDVSTKEQSKKSIKSNINEVMINSKDKTICIEESCYTLLATVQNSFEKKVILYNEKLKPTIQSFTENYTLEEKLKIIKIDNYKVMLEEINSSNIWVLKIFDINITKYKPQEIE